MRLKREQHLIFKNAVTLSQLRAKGLLPANFDSAIETETCTPDLNYLRYNITATELCVIFNPTHMQSLISDILKTCL